MWNISNGVSKKLFEVVIADFAKSAGAGKMKRIVLQIDGAGWHGPENIAEDDRSPTATMLTSTQLLIALLESVLAPEQGSSMPT